MASLSTLSQMLGRIDQTTAALLAEPASRLSLRIVGRKMSPILNSVSGKDLLSESRSREGSETLLDPSLQTSVHGQMSVSPTESVDASLCLLSRTDWL